MRVCLISREYPVETGWGGIGAYTFQHANALAKLGHDVEVIALASKETVSQPAIANGAADAAKYQIPLHRAVWGPILDELATLWISLPYSHYLFKTTIALWNKFHELHSKKPFDVVEAPEHLADGLIVALTKSCPLVVRLHTPHFKFVTERYHTLGPSFDQSLLGMLERMSILNADIISSPSGELANFVANDCGRDRNTIELVRNGVDIDKFSPSGGPQAIEPNGTVTVLFAGRLEERKGIHHLAEAIPKVLKQNKQIRFVIVGKDSTVRKHSVRDSIKIKLEAHGALKSVKFLDHVPLSEMPSLYRSADICIIPSLYDNAPYTVLEAMSCSKPVIASNVGGTPEYVEDGMTGILIPPGQSAPIAEAILKLAQSQTMRESYGSAARSKAISMLDSEIVAQQQIRLYQTAIERHKISKQFAQYQKSPEEVFTDFRDLLFSYHQNLYELIYLHSLTFRIKHWVQLAVMRPRFFVAKMAMPPLSYFRGRSKALDKITEKLERQINNKEAERDELLKSRIGSSLSPPPVRDLIDNMS